jgi:exonuclease III
VDTLKRKILEEEAPRKKLLEAAIGNYMNRLYTPIDFKTTQNLWRELTIKNYKRPEINPKPEIKAKSHTRTTPTPINNDPNHILSIISQNINGKYKTATEALGIITIDDPIQIICWQETKTMDMIFARDTSPALLERYEAIHRPLFEEEKEGKRIQNNSSQTTNSEGMITFISKEIFPNVQILKIKRRVISIALTVSENHYLIIINFYAPVDKQQNSLFWNDLEKKIKNYKTRLGGSKKEFIIVGDYNVTIHNWHSPNKESYTAKFVNIDKDTIHTLIENMKLTTAINSNKRFSYNKYTNMEKNKGWYRAMLDHILISEGSYGRITQAKYQKNTTILSGHLASLIRLKTESALCKKLKISERDQKANN